MCIHRLPPHLIKGNILQFISSVDTLSLRHTCRAMVEPCRDVSVIMNEMKSRYISYWKWLLRIVTHENRRRFLYWMVRNADIAPIRSLFASHTPLRFSSTDLVDILEAAVDSRDLRKVGLARGYTPIFFQEGALIRAVEIGFRNAYQLLAKVNGIPIESEPLARTIGRSHSLYAFEDLLRAGAPESIILTAVRENVKAGDWNLLYTLQSEWGVIAVDTEILGLSIESDNVAAFVLCLYYGILPEVEDSILVMQHNSVGVGRTWRDWGLPMMPNTRAWFDSL
jgi:hypothetical protein